ncbi:MAG: SPFH domain-containing protein [Paracoccaceae bacterium]
MAQISPYMIRNHVRAEASSFVQLFTRGRLTREGRGLSFWFDPRISSIAEVPMADRELTFLIKSQSADFQELSVQGTVLWHVADPARLAERVDFTLDLNTGAWLAEPEEHIRSLLIGLAREFTDGYLKTHGVRALLEAGLAPLQSAIGAGFRAETALQDIGLAVTSLRVTALSPSSELARALQAPTFESLQQQADEASFARRALAVEKESAIAQNELSNQIGLAAKRRDLIAREDENARSQAEAEAAALLIQAEAMAGAKVVEAEAEATRIRAVDGAAAEAERARMAALAQFDSTALFALAARDLAGKLDSIDSVTITPDMLSGLVRQLRPLLAQSAKG